MRDLIVFVLVIGMLPFCFTRPFFGLLVWSWLGYMNPHKLTWGIAYSFPFVQLAALFTLSGMLVMFFRGRSFPSISLQREGALLLALCAMFVATTFVALRPDLAWPELTKIAKVMIMTFATVLLVTDEKKLRQMALVVALSVGFFGLKGGIFSIITGGSHRVYGPPASSLADNTAVALGLVMVLPMLYFLARSEHNKWLRWALYLTFVLSIIAILFTYSRGGMLGLAVVLALIGLSFRLRTKIAALVILLIAAPIAIQQVPDQLIDRAETIQNYEEDGSAQARFSAWRTAWAIGLARPLTGGGFQIIDDYEIGRQYYPDFEWAGAHSIYFEVLGENGFVTLGIFLALLFSAILSAGRMKKVSLREGFEDFYAYGSMLQFGLCGYAVSGAFLEFASFDLYYQMIALTIVAKTILQRKVESAAEQTTEPELTVAARI